MASIAQDVVRRHRLTVNDYQRMGEAGIFPENTRVELIEGEIIDMAPIGSLHAGTVKRLIRVLDRAVGDAAIVSAQDPVVLGDYSEPQPDVALLRPREDFYASSHPQPEDILLIVEVSDTTLRYDREVKVPLYARHNVPEVWLINLEDQQLELFHSPGAEGYREIRILKQPGLITPKLLPGIEVNLAGLF